MIDLSHYTELTAKRGPQCSIGAALDNLPQEESELLAQILSLPNLVYEKFAEHCQEDFGLTVQASTVSRHVRRKCRCD
jgi:hypothetical protein